MKKLSSPLPQTLPKECEKAAKIFKSFVDSKNNGLDGVIPRSVLEHAKGFAIFTIFKAGFVVSARAGSGVVIAKLDNGTWSSPSAIGTAGLGVGGQLGAEMTDFLIVLNNRAAIQTFMAAGSLTLGGNMSLALGPLGRNGEAVGSVNTSGKLAAMYSYSKTRGLFGGLSIEGSVIVERQDANAIAYNSPVTARILLGGVIDPPPWAASLINTLEACTGMPGNRKWVEDQMDDGHYVFGGVASPGSEHDGLWKKGKNKKSTFPPASWGEPQATGSYFSSPNETNRNHSQRTGRPWVLSDPSGTESPVDPKHPRFTKSMSYTPSREDSPDPVYSSLSSRQRFHTKSQSMASPVTLNSSNPFGPSTISGRLYSADYDAHDIRETRNALSPSIKPKPELTKPLQPHEGIGRAIALYNFEAVESGDLSFSKGDVITIVKKSDSIDDWWTGKLRDRNGIFPANFVEVV